MLHAEAIGSGSSDSSDWQSCSEEAESNSGSNSGSLFQNLGNSIDASPRTLNSRLDDHSAHEPSNVVRPLSAQSLAQSIQSSSESPLTASLSLESFATYYSRRLPSGDPEPRQRTSSAFASGDASRPVFLLPAPTYNVASVRYPANFAGMDTVNVPELVERLGSEEDAVRKMAVFKLQSNIGDPSFAEIFIQEGGLQKLTYLTMHATRNTLAYSLTSFSRLLEVDKGWDFVEHDLIERVRTSILYTHALHIKRDLRWLNWWLRIRWSTFFGELCPCWS